MARVRIGTQELARLLDSAAQPIYVLNDEQVLVFCNRACLEWVGCAAEQLQGRRCAYHSSPEVGGIDAIAAGLCPPPAAAGRDATATVGCVTPEGRLRRRRARFVPIGGDADSDVGLLVLVEPHDLAEGGPSAEPSDGEAVRLHECVRQFRQQTAAKFRADRLIGDSPAVRRVRAQVDAAVASRANVLIVGPPGSGRQHVASAIHYAGRPECAGPLIPLSCSVLDAELIQSTLAALTTRGVPGGPGGSAMPAEIAAPGTLLLNDVDTLSLDAQCDLARIFCRAFPLRILATAQIRPGDPIGGQVYREELLAVVGTLVIELPALAERRGDLPALLQLFVEEANARGGKQLAGFTPEALDVLDGYAWPGNLDELIQVVRQSHGRAEGTHIVAADLPERLHLAALAAAHPRRAEERIVLDEFLPKIEQELLRRAMARAKGNKTKAAKLLGLTRPRLYRRLVQLGLDNPPGTRKGAGKR